VGNFSKNWRTVSLLANGNRIFSREIAAGPFQIPQLPVVTGAGTISMTVTDALGQQRAVTLPFYASSNLLAPGLQTFSAELGAVRRNFGVASNDYSTLAGSGTFRRGLSPAITVEAAAEASANLVKAGGGVVVNLFNQAVLNLAVAGSTGTARPGLLVSAGLQRTGQMFSAGVSAIATNQSFRDVASLSGDPVPRLQLSANAGVSLGRFGSLGVAYASLDQDKVPLPVKLYLPPGSLLTTGETLVNDTISYQPAQHAHVLSASYSLQIADVSFYATGYRDFAHNGASGVLVGLTIPLGTRSSAGISGGPSSSGRSGQIQAQQSPVAIGDVGYQAFASDSSVRHEFGEVQYKAPWSLLTAGADRIGNQTSLHAESQGAVAFADGSVFASNTIADSFAVVDTNGLANVRVLSENRDAGRTDANGQLLVPDLRSFDVNRIAINPSDVPLDAAITDATREVRPQDRSGVVVRFAVRNSHGALLRIVDQHGIPIPVGSTATLRPKGTSVPVGFDGNAYVEDLSAHNEVLIELPTGKRCTVTFDYKPVSGEIPTIGPLPCIGQ